MMSVNSDIVSKVILDQLLENFEVDVSVEIKPMEEKKTQPTITTTAATTKAQPITLTDAASFVGNVKDELRKITWTSPEELKTYTQITVGATFALGLGIYFIDILIQLTLNGISNTVRFIFG